jgi:uncharacterized short protein YbdD (DUF466 family)
MKDDDFTLAIMLGAMAVECELAFMFFKWTRIDMKMKMSNLGADIKITQGHEDAWEKQYRNWFRITEKLDNVSQHLTGLDFDIYTGRTPLAELMRSNHPESIGKSAKKFFEEHLFWKRNQIVHSGKVDFAKDEAEQCLALASTIFSIMKAMDRERNNRTFSAQGVTPTGSS